MPRTVTPYDNLTPFGPNDGNRAIWDTYINQGVYQGYPVYAGPLRPPPVETEVGEGVGGPMESDLPTSQGYGFDSSPSFGMGTVGALGQMAATGGLFGALGAPASMATDMALSNTPGLASSAMGDLVQSPTAPAFSLGSVASGLLGMINPALGAFSGVAGHMASKLGDRIADAMDARDMESFLDGLEDTYGYGAVSGLMDSINRSGGLISQGMNLSANPDIVTLNHPQYGPVNVSVKALMERAKHEHATRFQDAKFSKDETNAIWGGKTKNPEMDIDALAKNVAKNPSFYGTDSRRKAEKQLGLEDGTLDTKAITQNQETKQKATEVLGKLNGFAKNLFGGVPEETQTQVENPNAPSTRGFQGTRTSEVVSATEAARNLSEAEKNLNSPGAVSGNLSGGSKKNAGADSAPAESQDGSDAANNGGKEGSGGGSAPGGSRSGNDGGDSEGEGGFGGKSNESGGYAQGDQGSGERGGK